jgi:transposase
VEEWVGQDHPARFVRDYVDALDLEGLGFKTRQSEVGRPNYAADLLLKVWVYGYLTRTRSTRKLEAACRENMGLIWLTGDNTPDHNSLWRFWRDNKDALKGIFRTTVEVAQESGLIGLTLHALDGTKIAARVSRRGSWHEEDLRKVLEEFERGVDESEVLEKHGYSLPEQVRQPGKLKERIEQALKVMKEAGAKHYHPRDAEARVMKTSDGLRFGYNAQVVSDGASGLIVAQEVTSRASDSAELAGMIEKVEETLGSAAAETVADGGYNDGEQLAKAEEAGYGVVVGAGPNDRKAGVQYHKSEFRYDAERDVCVCPLGQELMYERTRKARRNLPELRVYRCRKRDCPARRKCSRDPQGRGIEVGPYDGAVARQREKRDVVGRELLKKRSEIIERVFGWIKEAMGFRRWTVQGICGVRVQWSLMCTTVNLRKLHRLWVAGRVKLAAG